MIDRCSGGAHRCAPRRLLLLAPVALALLGACGSDDAPADASGPFDAGTRDGGNVDSAAGRTGFGEQCELDEECAADAPSCVELAAPAYAPGVCASACGEGGACPNGSECHDEVCIRCAAEIAGTVAPGGACGCSADCGSGGACEDGVCEVDCASAGCPEGSSCDGTPPTCRECLGGEPGAEDAECTCDADCEGDLACIGESCARPCAIDENCGADECRHELLLSPPSCAPPGSGCVGNGDVAIGGDCACNADCAAAAPLCLGLFAAGQRRLVCSTPCGPEQPCPGDLQCCSSDGASPYCIAASLAGSPRLTCM
ncbi:hypothetical protein [Sandaracinus amylolyticus]|uniref:hypothetical protein n=1 Tax=Sandaracinus amylolyticus TaxID=927083 RepID=UPI001F3B8E19|nr:hypothetical protein [Sandaracinus amylolyticus]UJR79543.1 Hypothetical protein I5071_15790 [Sandaracinus amylolyticus]